MTTTMKRATILLSVLLIISSATFICLVFSKTGYNVSKKTPPLVVTEAKYVPPVEEEASATRVNNVKPRVTAEPEEVAVVSEETAIEPEWADAEIESDQYYDQAFYAEGDATTNVVTASGDDGYVNANVDGNWVAGSELRFSGVYQDSSGYSYTYYSENVLPGGGLNIPGRHVGDEGYVMDGDGNLCVASSDLPYGTVVSVPFGTGTAVVYDTGCSSGILDVYVSW